MNTKGRLAIVAFFGAIVTTIATSEKTSAILGWTFEAPTKVILTLILAAMCCLVLSIMPKDREFIDMVGKHVLITGCDSGFGHKLAQVLSARGCNVYAGCLFPDGEGSKKLETECNNVRVVPLDVTSEESVEQARVLVERGLPDGQSLFGIVNNAGIWRWGEIEWCDVDIFKQVMDVNAFGMVRVTKAFLPYIRESHGRIINVSSMLGTFSVPAGATYSMSKFAIESFSDCLRIEMRQWGVKVSIIQPGWYARATGIFGGHNDADLVSLTEGVWRNMSAECKRDYGREYFDAQVKELMNNRLKTSSDASPVLDAMVDALTAKHPKHRYLVGGFLNTVVLSYVNRFLPSWVTDYGFACAMSILYPTPAALIQKADDNK